MENEPDCIEDRQVEINSGEAIEPTTTRPRRIVSAGRIGLLLTLLPYLFFFVCIPVITPYRFWIQQSETGRFVFFLLMQSIGWLSISGSFFAFRAMIRNSTYQPNANKTDFTLGLIAFAFLLLNIFLPMNAALSVGMLKRFAEPAHRGEIRDDTANNLRALYGEYMEYAQMDPEKRLPSLSEKPGRLMQDAEEMRSSRIPSYYIAQNDPDYKSFYEDLNYMPADNVDMEDWSFFYLGYAIHSEEEMKAFAEWYLHGGAARDGCEKELSLPNETASETALSIPRLNIQTPPLTPDAKRPPLPRSLPPDIPILIERIDHNRNKGGHVLFMDGHVEFIEYPGKWPMTENTVALLNEMDRLQLSEDAR